MSPNGERCWEKSVYTGRGINLEKCVFSGCNITFVVDETDCGNICSNFLQLGKSLSPT